VDPVSRDHLVDDHVHHAFADGVVGNVGGVLRGQHDRVGRNRLAVFITESHLRFRVRAQPGQFARLAHFRLAFAEAVRVLDRRRHQHIGFVGGVAEHQALVAGALVFRFGAVDALVDVRRLRADQVQHAAGRAVEVDVRTVVADAVDHAADDAFVIDPGGGGDLAGHDGDAGLHQRFAGHARVFILRDDGVEDGVRHLVGDLVRMAFGNGFGREQVTV
jgi:hypothetical protein